MNKLLKILNVVILSASLLVSFSFPVTAQEIGYSRMTREFTVDPEASGLKIPLGSVIYHSANNVTTVYGPGNTLLLKVKDSEADFISTPHGLMRASHVYDVPSGTIISHVGNVVKLSLDNKVILTIINRENSNIQQYPVPASGGGWVESASFNVTATPTDMSAWWTCPVGPTSGRSGTVVYLFPSIHYTGANIPIIQPVLQWNHAGSGRWQGASWYAWGTPNVDADGIMSSAINVSTNDLLYGTINLTGTPNFWTISFWVQNTTTSTVLGWSTNVSINNVNWVDIALEAYNADGLYLLDSDMPGDTTFTSINVSRYGQDIPLNWNKLYGYGNGNFTSLSWTPWEYYYNVQLASGNRTVSLNTYN